MPKDKRETHGSMVIGDRIVWVPKRQTTCEHCKTPFLTGHCGPTRRHCSECVEKYNELKRYAINKVGRAIRDGKLKPASKYKCVDCGRRAAVWEHRSYLAPLDVVPTCKTCNNLRGGAKWQPMDLPVPPVPATYSEAPDCAAITLVAAA